MAMRSRRGNGLSGTVLRAFLMGACGTACVFAQSEPKNLARDAHASASETYTSDLSPEKANDGDADSRWSGIPGHNQGVWFQLEWKMPIEVGEVVIRQHDTYVR